jgi:flavin reductase (DIM6/NTAB) family NADH-FMN oxidoreductase RutF
MPARSDQSADFRRALAQYPTGVTVVTTIAPDGTPTGLTVNSFSSVSLDPPLVLWCLSLKADSLAVFRECERYLIHVLAVDQLSIAKRFATRGADKFGPTAWRPTDDGLPLLEGCVAWFECGNRSQYEEGDHVVLIGRVEAFQTIGGAPLIFHNARYVSHLAEAPLPPALRTRWD